MGQLCCTQSLEDPKSFRLLALQFLESRHQQTVAHESAWVFFNKMLGEHSHTRLSMAVLKPQQRPSSLKPKIVMTSLTKKKLANTALAHWAHLRGQHSDVGKSAYQLGRGI